MRSFGLLSSSATANGVMIVKGSHRAANLIVTPSDAQTWLSAASAW